MVVIMSASVSMCALKRVVSIRSSPHELVGADLISFLVAISDRNWNLEKVYGGVTIQS